MSEQTNITEKTTIVFVQPNGRSGWYYLRIENQPEKRCAACASNLTTT